MIRLKRLKSLAAFTLTVGLLLVLNNFYMINIHSAKFASEQPNFRSSKDSTINKKDECNLVILDPWDPQILPHLHPNWNPYKVCNKTREMYTELKNGILRMTNESTSDCWYRCLYVQGELDLKPHEWAYMFKNASYQVDCEFIETICQENNVTTFRYIHDQLIRPKKKVFQKEDNLHPGVFILVFDATSSSSGIRSFMETNQILRQLYDATTFYFHNKVGINSRENAFAIFSGTRVAKLNKLRFPDRSESEYPNSCTNGLKRNETVTYDFIDQNYASITAEDWIGAFNWPNCKGYKHLPTDHHCNALVLKSTFIHSPIDGYDFNIHYYIRECHFPHDKLMNFVTKFLNEYKGISKFVMVWLSLFSHNSPSGLFSIDKHFANFFRDHAENLNNSFIFLLGDHGLRFGDIRRTPVGQMEDNNPLLVVALPKYLRSNKQLILNLKRNSRKHTSQYDIYATLYDIARLARKDNFQKWDEHDFSNEFGEIRGGIRAKSILRPITYDRTCGEMEIPEEYCICEQKWQKIDVQSDDAIRAGNTLMNHINSFLNNRNLSSICDKLDFIAVVSAERLEMQSLIKVVVSAFPSYGKYEAQLLIEEDKFTVITKVVRVDEYGNQGDCLPDEDARHLCYCLQQLTTTATK